MRRALTFMRLFDKGDNKSHGFDIIWNSNGELPKYFYISSYDFTHIVLQPQLPENVNVVINKFKHSVLLLKISHLKPLLQQIFIRQLVYQFLCLIGGFALVCKNQFDR